MLKKKNLEAGKWDKNTAVGGRMGQMSIPNSVDASKSILYITQVRQLTLYHCQMSGSATPCGSCCSRMWNF